MTVEVGVGSINGEWKEPQGPFLLAQIQKLPAIRKQMLFKIQSKNLTQDVVCLDTRLMLHKNKQNLHFVGGSLLLTVLLSGEQLL